MAVFRQRGRKVWQIRVWVDGRQKSISSGTDDEVEAKRMEAEIVAGMRGRAERRRVEGFLNEVMGERRREGMRLDGVMDVYKGMVSLSAKEIALRGYHWRMLVEWMRGQRPDVVFLHEMEGEAAYAFVEWLKGTERKGKTVNNIRGNCRAIVNKVRHVAGLNVNVFEYTPTAGTEDSEKGRAFTDDEVGRILRRAKRMGEEWYGACLVGLYTGLRRGDVVGLRWGDIVTIDDMNGLRREDVATCGDGELAIVVSPGKTKRHGVEVLVPVHEKLGKWLRKARKREGGEWVFPRLQGKYGRMNTSEKWKISEFTKILIGAKVEAKGVTFHSWRHTFNTRLARAGVAKDVRMKLGGWTVEKTEGRYDHDLEGLKEAIGRLE